MSTATLTAMTTEEMLALPNNGVERWLDRGELQEKPMTVRNRWHSRLMVRISYFLESWLERQPEPRGSVLCGEAGVRLRRDPDTTVGVDVVYISPQVAAHQAMDTTLIDGVPTLVVEILSPNDVLVEINRKLDLYLGAGVRLIWVIDPHDRTVVIYRPECEPEMVNIRQHLAGGDELPGFHIAIDQLFV
jgi:Uma2 family endonuclease